MRNRKNGNSRPSLGRFGVLVAVLLSCCSGNDPFLLLRPQIRFQGSTDPAPGTVTLVESAFSGSPGGGSVFVDVVLTDTAGVFGIDFDLVFASDRFILEEATEGSFLNENGTVQTQFVVNSQTQTPATERIIVGLTRVQAISTPDLEAVGERILMTLEFRAATNQSTSSPLSFDGSFRAPEVFSGDGTTVVDETNFHGGTLRIELIP